MWMSRGDSSRIILLNPISIWSQLGEHCTSLNLTWQAAGKKIASAVSSDGFVTVELYTNKG